MVLGGSATDAWSAKKGEQAPRSAYAVRVSVERLVDVEDKVCSLN